MCLADQLGVPWPPACHELVLFKLEMTSHVFLGQSEFIYVLINSRIIMLECTHMQLIVETLDIFR